MRRTVNATREVILAAGGVHTPQLLQLSGIGPKAVLDGLKIPVLVDLPGTGENFQDHVVGLALSVHQKHLDGRRNLLIRDVGSKHLLSLYVTRAT